MSLLKETRKLMPGRARSHWSLTEDEQLQELGSWEDDDEEGFSDDPETQFGFYMDDALAAIVQKNARKAKQLLHHAEVELKKIPGSARSSALKQLHQAKMRLKRIKESAPPLEESMKFSVKRRTKAGWGDFMLHKPGLGRGRGGHVYDILDASGNAVGYTMDNFAYWGSKGVQITKPMLKNWKELHAWLVSGVEDPWLSEIKKVLSKSESVAGAPGAFAISDAEPRTMKDQVADLLDRVHNPRWEYPSWALPKVKLDEAGKELTSYQAAQLLHRHISGDFKYKTARGTKVSRKAFTKMLDALIKRGFIDKHTAAVTAAGRAYLDVHHMEISLSALESLESRALPKVELDEAAPKVAEIEDWWEYMDPGSQRSVAKQVRLSTTAHRRWNATDWERVMDYYVQKELGDPRGYSRGRNV